jgi:predicted dienelactone hydrolase
VWHLARVRTRVVLVSALLTALLAACGSPGDDSSSATSAQTPTSAAIATSTTEAELTAPTTQATTTSVEVSDPAVAYSEPGPFPVGVAELTDGPVPITVFYPGLDGAEDGKQEATYDLRAWLPPAEAAKVGEATTVPMHAYVGLTPADPDGGPYPLVLFSHGLAGYRLQSTFLTTHLASWGFVVAAVEHPYRNLTAAFGDLGSLVAGFGSTDAPDVAQLVAAIDQVQAAASQSTGPLAGLTVETTDVGAVGHSAGGFAVYGAAAVDPRIVTYVALASPTGGTFSDTTPTTAPAVPPPDKPSLLIAGSADVIAPLPRVEAAYEALPTPKALAVIEGLTHLGFMDICEATPPGEPNVLQVAKSAGVAVPDLVLRLFADGCDPKYTSPSSAWPAIDALTTAHLRGLLGLDDPPVVLTQADLDAAFPDLHLTLSRSP